MCNPHGAASGIGHSLEGSHREAGQANAACNIRVEFRGVILSLIPGKFYRPGAARGDRGAG